MSNYKSKTAFASLLLVLVALFSACNLSENSKIPVLFDTDANNEVDDQHALAYLLFSGDHFKVEGITVNATSAPTGYSENSDVSDHYEEAKRVMQLCGDFYGEIPLKTGANGSFSEIKEHIGEPDFDGHEAVDFIIEQAMKKRNRKLVLLPVGKLTNIALALMKEPAIAENVRIVWLGSNYPEPGEHNQDWDIESMNYILDANVPFEMVTVRYGKPSGTAAVMVSQDQILHRMPGKGPKISAPVAGRHGGEFSNFGDYSVNLFSQFHMWGDPIGRALFDMAAVAVVKNPDWAEKREIPAPIYVNGKWVERPNNPRKILLWEWFDIYGIMNDFFVTMDDYKLVNVR
ncbi:Inosine-uridine nucleoside N-ribohydrolase [Mariniphaga anaerophila]|uniref:Inosine-uridine nucleoside N-ribohydrolase n=1 Tax=Mariniphaga anaerophila TaxID=1484053 RepID=A0A1M5G8L9_9BACT|nr:nucleoside hydrolase [Mariniphaga anaerophila]SHG00066.1 Inosine-uridine nucleoside N-ribohydrolase [Mariniphaga anaerophila]